MNDEEFDPNKDCVFDIATILNNNVEIYYQPSSDRLFLNKHTYFGPTIMESYCFFDEWGNEVEATAEFVNSLVCVGYL